MKRAFLLSALLATLVATGAQPSSGKSGPARFYAPPGHYVMATEAANIFLLNETDETITMGETWDLKQVDGDGTSFYEWPQDQLVIPPGEQRLWQWNQRINQCFGICQNVREGDPAPAGRYEVTTTIDGVGHTARFTLGQYFTLGFEGRPGVEFSLFVGTQPEIDQMTAEADSSEKNLIVSGLVRKNRDYNPGWNFSMGTHSIVMGEVFIEVCDGSPYYVNRNRKEWQGERWCPWDSYVKRVGR